MGEIDDVEVVDEGLPSVFLTFSPNLEWPEITEALPAGQSVYENTSIVRSVFDARFGDFLRNHPSEYRIEYQVRGLPHVHLIVPFEDCSLSKESLRLRGAMQFWH